MNSVAITLDAVFNETVGRIKEQFTHYATVYDLPRLQYIQHTCHQTIDYIQKKNGFVVLVIYTNEGKVFATYDWTTRWLPWSSIKNNENIHDTIDRISKRLHPEINIRDVHPMCFIDNTFCHKSHAHTLSWMVFTAKISNSTIIENIWQGGLFPLHDEFIEWVHKYGNKDILTYFLHNKLWQVCYTNRIDWQDEEIEINEKMKYRYMIHRAWGKPILKLLWCNKNEYIKKRILEKCGDNKKIIDVSCWDDNLVNILGDNENNIVIANDISWSQISLLWNNHNNVLFTNHNASQLPFKNKVFDVAICKNTLHHMPHRSHLLSLLTSMKHIAKKIIIVEIENPNNTWWLAKLLHNKRYRWFLKDVGWAYFDKKQFTNIIQNIFSETHNIEQGMFSTPQGNYFWWVIEQK